MSTVSKGRKLQKAYAKINTKTGRSDRRIILERFVPIDPENFDPDKDDAPKASDLRSLVVYEFPPGNGCILQAIPEWLILTSNGKFRRDDWRIIFPGGLKNGQGQYISDAELRAVQQVRMGEPGIDQLIYEVVESVQPYDKESIAFGVILEWSCIIRKIDTGEC